MRTVMSVAIAVALTLLVVPAMVEVSAGAQEPALPRVIKDDITMLSEMVGLLAEDMRSAGVQVPELVIQIQPDVQQAVVRCRDGEFCVALGNILVGAGWSCRENIFGTIVCRSP
jgi:hypothetical protein